MNERPEQPPEGRLLAAATERSGLSIREASKRAGISYGRWRQVTSGVQHVSPGEFAAVHAPAKTLAKMAAAVGVTPEQMEAEGQRPDAAEAMRRPAPGAPSWAAPGSAPSPLPTPPQSEVFDAPTLAALAPKATAILRRLDEVREAGIPNPDGWQMFPDDHELALGWQSLRSAGFAPEEALWYLSAGWAVREQEGRDEDRHRSGTSGALVRS